MKIGILTLPLHTNYGGILQAYALQTVLERMGHDVKVIDRPWRKRINWLKFPLQLLKRSIKRFVFRKNVAIFTEKEWNKNQIIVEKNTREFINRYIHTYRVDKLSDIKEDNFDVIVVGSDQVWRPKYFHLFYKNIVDAFLAFAENWNIKRIAYAPSFGTDEWEFTKEETIKCKSLIKRFDFVSVREKSGVNLCKKYLDTDVEWVLDPTLLLQQSDYTNLIKGANLSQCKGGLFCYILDMTKEKMDIIQKYAKNRGLVPDIIEISKNNKNYLLNEGNVPTVEQWLFYFYNARFVITDSFHGCVFSIIFGKPFMALANSKRGLSRIQSLFEMLELQDHLVINCDEYQSGYSYCIASSTYVKLNQLQVKSRKFMLNNI